MRTRTSRECFLCVTLSLVFVLAFVLAAAGGPLKAQDEPNPRLEPAEHWLLDFRFEKLRMVTPRRGPGKGKTYWYMVYTLENKTGKDRDFHLTITARSDRNKVYADLFLPSVEREIERQEGKSLWGRTDRFSEIAERDPKDEGYLFTTIRSDENGKNARRCMAVFNPLDRNAQKIVIEISGLTNDIEEATRPDGTVVLRERVRVLEFHRPGDEYEITLDSFKLVSRRWEVRESPLEPAAGS